jgi:hypothetical protein
MVELGAPPLMANYSFPSALFVRPLRIPPGSGIPEGGTSRCFQAGRGEGFAVSLRRESSTVSSDEPLRRTLSRTGRMGSSFMFDLTRTLSWRRGSVDA